MARPTKPTPSRAGKAASKPTKAATRPTTAARGKQVAASPSKDELRARVEKLERANTILRTKNRAGLANFHEASDRVTELETRLEKLEVQLSRSSAGTKAKPAADAAKPKRSPSRRQRTNENSHDADDVTAMKDSKLHSDPDETATASMQ
ncbi:hypothetical protein HN018_19070 [Lichenicola cladoniae]|uniref:Uncharacterized protein n=1 Tax=Lichenicola cladoniae TaxID=1484109 RepID=A0A6M8HU55_9PROT|nr:hypothetical protein [Lichenicola cladoniae]NPD68249.1 hypothetical protein [Acetobacteraceae bacterium]QKE91850.1 hypothetical protein HN018_19070 [Lichenicola cladoniae]